MLSCYRWYVFVFCASVCCLQVVKVIQKLANTSNVRESYMKPLETFVKTHNEELKVPPVFHTKYHFRGSQTWEPNATRKGKIIQRDIQSFMMLEGEGGGGYAYQLYSCVTDLNYFCVNMNRVLPPYNIA